MAATLLIRQWNGTSGSQVATDQTSGNVRFKTADNSSGTTTNNPISIPTSSSNWSFTVYVRIDISVAPAVQVSNLTFFPGTISWTGCHWWTKNNGSTYTTPALETASTGYTDASTFNSGATLSLSVTNAGPYTTTGDIGDYQKSALEVTSSAVNGQLSPVTATYSWLEI